MGRIELIEEFEKEFLEIKKKYKFKTSLEELQDMLYIKDFILKEKYISNNLIRFICSKIIDHFNGWGNYLHNIVIPNPHSLININESQMFDEKEKHDIMILIAKIMRFSSKNSVNGLEKNYKNDAKFIDEAVHFWKNEFKPQLHAFLSKESKAWEKKSKEEFKADRREGLS